MPIEVELPDGNVVEFPDGTDNATMERALASYSKAPASPKTAYEAPDPAQGMSGLGLGVAGLGKSFVDTYRGGKQAITDSATRSSVAAFAGLRAAGLDDAANWTARNIGNPLVNQQTSNQREIDEANRTDAPLMNTGAGFAGNLTGQVVQAAAPVPGGGAVQATRWLGRAAPYVAAAARGGAYSASQPVLTGDTRVGNAATGAAFGAAGQAVGSGLGRILKGGRDKLSPVLQDVIAKAQAAGIPLHPSQISDSKFIKTLSSAASYLPFSGSAKAARNQQEAFNRALGKTIGVDDASAFTDDVIRKARNAISRQYDDVFGRNDVVIDAPTLKSLVAVNREAASDVTGDGAAVVGRQLQKILRDIEPDGSMPGARYQSLRSKLQKVAAGKSEGDVRDSILGLRKVLDRAAKESVGPEDAAALGRANNQWANLRTIEDALQQSAGAHGNVNPANLWNLIRNGSTGEMRELARVGKTVLQNPIPDSGTAGRQIAYGVMGAPGSTLGALTGGPGGALAALLAPVAAGLTFGRAFNNPIAARYLTQGLGDSANRAARVIPPLLAASAPAVANAQKQKSAKPARRKDAP